MHVCIIFSLYYFFPCFTPLCVSLIVVGLFSLLFLRLFETRLSAFWVPNNQVSQALSHEGEPMGGSKLYVQGLCGGKGGWSRKALLLNGPSVQEGQRFESFLKYLLRHIRDFFGVVYIKKRKIMCYTVKDFMQIYTWLNIGSKKSFAFSVKSKAGKVHSKMGNTFSKLVLWDVI